MLSIKDLNHVSFGEALKHPPIFLVKEGKPLGNLCIMAEKPSSELAFAIEELQECISLTTGVRLPVVHGRVMPPCIAVGDSCTAEALGLVGKNLRVEGFAIKTEPGIIHIVGHDENFVDEVASHGTAWGVLEFAERFLGVRWYWPMDRNGRSIVPSPDLTINPVYLHDAPVFRKRSIWPKENDGACWSTSDYHQVQRALRAFTSWPVEVAVHKPLWGRINEYREKMPEVFQLRIDGTRNYEMLCYGNPKTLETFVENISSVYDNGEPVDHIRIGIIGDTISVSPNDMAVECHCADCRRLWDASAGRFGTASRIMADFVTRLALIVKERWPDKTILFQNYLNYTLAPKGYKFPGNVEIQTCGMPGIAQYKEPSILKADQDNLDAWIEISGRKAQTWHYSCWPADRTKALYQYPHVLKDYCESNRDKLVGIYNNGGWDHWTRQHVSMYAWLKVLWNPDFDVDAAIDEYCRRMYGPSADLMREFTKLQIDGWEKSVWPNAVMSAKAVYRHGFDESVVEQMKNLYGQAKKLAEGNVRVMKNLEYLERPLAEFVREYEFVLHGKGARPLISQKTGEKPIIDGKLNDDAWSWATPVLLVVHSEEGEMPTKYPTEVRSIWTAEGIAFGFRMTEPDTAGLCRDIQARDDSQAWHQDCVEVFLDVTGKNEGRFYQFILTAGNAIFDSKYRDQTWDMEGIESAVHIDEGYWSLEVFLPFSEFEHALNPGLQVQWCGQITRHRSKSNKADGIDENQRMNTQFGGFNDNLANFGPIQFVE